MNAIHRLSALLSMVLGRVLFGEPGPGARLGAAALTVPGGLCLLLAK